MYDKFYVMKFLEGGEKIEGLKGIRIGIYIDWE